MSLYYIMTIVPFFLMSLPYVLCTYIGTYCKVKWTYYILYIINMLYTVRTLCNNNGHNETTAGTQAHGLASGLTESTPYIIIIMLSPLSFWDARNYARLYSMVYWPVWDMLCLATGTAWRMWCPWTSCLSDRRRRPPTWPGKLDGGLAGHPTPPRRSPTPSDGSSTLRAGSTFPTCLMGRHRPAK